MTILFTGRKAHLSPDLRALAEEKLAKLEKVLGDILDAHVVLKREKHRHLAEIVVQARGARLAAKVEAAEFPEALGVCADRLLSQARRHRDRRVTRRKGRGRGGAARSIAAAAETPLAAGDGVPEVVRLGRVPVRSMSVREALLRAREAEDAVVVFRDPASQQLAVLVRREDGQYGLVETEA